MIRVLRELLSIYDTSVRDEKSGWLLGYFTFFWAFFLDFIESKPFSYRHFRLFQQALSRVCGKKFVGGVRSRSSVVSSRSFQALLPSLFVPFLYYKKDNARFLKVLILFSQHEHRILTGQKPYFKRVLPLFSKP